jgi:hypothetical protein
MAAAAVMLASVAWSLEVRVRSPIGADEAMVERVGGR